MARLHKYVLGSAVCAALALSLAGCGSGGHQVIASNEDCSSCHSTDKPQFDSVASPKAEIVTCAPGSTVSVYPNGQDAVLCQVIFTAEDGSKFVPVMSSSLGSSETTFEAKEGLWAVVADEGDSSHGVLLMVEAGAPSDDVNIEL